MCTLIRLLPKTVYSLQDLQEKVDRLQPGVSQLGQDMMAVKQLVARSRPGMARTHPDVQRLEKETDAVTTRWENLHIQATER